MGIINSHQVQQIGLVSVLYKSDKVLNGFIKSLAEQTFKNYVLYIIDNSPNPYSTKLLQQLLANIGAGIKFKHIICDTNIGVAAANNIGISASLKDKCNYVLLLNNDIEFEQNFLLEKILTIAMQKKDTMVVPKILYFDTRNIWLAGGYYSKLRALGVHIGKGKNNDVEYPSRYITYAPTCFMLIPVKVFFNIGIMDSQYFVYSDDTDFVYRALQNGFKLWHENSLNVLHKVSSSTGGDNSDVYIFYSNRNKIYFIKKHYRGILKYVSLAYYFFTRIFFYIRFNATQKRSLLRGIKAGLKLSFIQEEKL